MQHARRRWRRVVAGVGLAAVLLGPGGAASATGPVLSAVPDTYVALGDSYASGEGVEPFLPGSDDAAPQNRCHRSADAYPRLLTGSAGFPSRNLFVACSGASIANFYPGHGQWGEPGQLERLGADATVVTLSVGGNDLQFSVVLETCLLLRGCQTRLEVPAALLRQRTRDRLVALYRDVLAAAPRAAVYVVGYPRFLAVRPSVLCIAAGLDPAETDWFSRQVEAMDTTTRDAVAAIGDPRLHYVSTLDAMAGGEACSARGSFVHALVPRHLTYSFHPTRAGQALLALRVADAVRR